MSKKSWLSQIKELYEREESRLDQEIEKGLTEPSQRALHDLHPEMFVKEEEENEKRINNIRDKEKQQYRRLHAWSMARGVRWMRAFYRLMACLVCFCIIALLMQTVLMLPPFGEADNPYNNEVSARYIEQGIEDTGAINFVTGMILDYRAFDTFGESTVLFVAACSVMLILRLNRTDKNSKAVQEAEFDDRHHEPKNDVILQLAARVLIPVIFMFGFYIILNGHLSPGGGFSGGAVMGAGLMLYLNAFGFEKTERFFTYNTFKWVSFVSLFTYCGLKTYSFFMGANHLESGISTGTAGNILSAGLILPLNICVGFVVMCTMYAFYTLFRRGSM